MGVEEKEIRGVLSDDAINQCRNDLFIECLRVAENWLGYSAVREDIFSDIKNPDALTAFAHEVVKKIESTRNEDFCFYMQYYGNTDQLVKSIVEYARKMQQKIS